MYVVRLDLKIKMAHFLSFFVTSNQAINQTYYFSNLKISKTKLNYLKFFSVFVQQYRP